MRTALVAWLAIAALAISAAAFVALQLAASRAVGETGIGSQRGVTCPRCGAGGYYTEEALRRWHVLTVKTYHLEAPGPPDCAHEWEPSSQGGDACGPDACGAWGLRAGGAVTHRHRGREG